MLVPFIGWSTSADQFRRLTAAKRLAYSTLIVGEPGVGKRTMALAIRSAARGRGYQLTTEEINHQTSSIPGRCIAVSHSPIGSGRDVPPGRVAPRTNSELLPLHLDTGKYGPIPDNECQGMSLNDGIISQFVEKLYVPPLRRRQIDILALLHFCGTRVFPELKLKCNKVSSKLIHQLILDSSWLGNEAALVHYLVVAAQRSGVNGKQDSGLSDSDDTPDTSHEQPSKDTEKTPNAASNDNFDSSKDVVLREDESLGAFRTEFARVPHLNHQRVNWDSDDVAVPFESLPKVALAIFLSRIFYVGTGDSFYPHPYLGEDDRWMDDSLFDEIADIAEANTEDILVAGLPWMPDDVVPKEFVREVEEFEEFGATIKSLQAGFRVTPDQIPIPIFNAIAGTTKKTTKRRPSKTPLPLTDRQRQYLELKASGKTSKEIAEELGVSKQSVSKTLKAAEQKIKQAIREGKSGTRSVPTTIGLPLDKRGQEMIVSDDDKDDDFE